jgi:hypothetical protein
VKVAPFEFVDAEIKGFSLFAYVIQALFFFLRFQV